VHSPISIPITLPDLNNKKEVVNGLTICNEFGQEYNLSHLPVGGFNNNCRGGWRKALSDF